MLKNNFSELRKGLNRNFRIIINFYFYLGTREMAFVHAISSAGVAHALTRACSSGELENCGCDRSLRGMSPEGFQVRHFSIIDISFNS